MKSLAYTLKLMLDDLPFISGKTHTLQVNREFRGSLSQAIALYSETRIEALNTLYKSEAVTKERRSRRSRRDRSELWISFVLSALFC